ncbi:MAG: DUF1007 family protein [Arenicellales bacterium]|nr:DUF1007 family protein [Arenicellales bacterium]
MAGLMLLLLLGNSAPQAHPHHWIDVFAEWQFNPKGLISGVKLRWLFDDYYSVLLTDDAAATGEELQAILNQILSNTSKHHYFIRIEHEGGEAKLGTPEQTRIGMRDHRIEIEFRLPMTVPLDPTKSDIVYRVAEPTYFVEMLHAEEGPAIVLKDAPPACRYHLEAPRPDAALVAYAASLGINESGGDDLGIQFSETVTIRCE